MAAYGYNRDKKKGKKQIVIGLLTDKEGYPLSVEVFKGNTSDTKTVSNQLAKLKDNFGVERVIFVGDKGMIKSTQIEEITSDTYKWNYLITITKQQIRGLLDKGTIQLSLFDTDLVEVETEDHIRYILRRNPMRARELKENRESKIEHITEFAAKQNLYLEEHKKAKTETALRKVEDKIAALKRQAIIVGKVEERNIVIETDIAGKKKEEELDGCYASKNRCSQRKPYC